MGWCELKEGNTRRCLKHRMQRQCLEFWCMLRLVSFLFHVVCFFILSNWVTLSFLMSSSTFLWWVMLEKCKSEWLCTCIIDFLLRIYTLFTRIYFAIESRNSCCIYFVYIALLNKWLYRTHQKKNAIPYFEELAHWSFCLLGCFNQ